MKPPGRILFIVCENQSLPAPGLKFGSQRPGRTALADCRGGCPHM